MDTTKTSEDGENWGCSFIYMAICSVIILPIVMWFWPSSFPFSYWGMWTVKGNVWLWLMHSLPIFIWGISVTILHSTSTRNSREYNRNAEDIIIGGTFISILAGVIEELSCRWLFFMWNIFTTKVVNFFFFGFLGFGVPKWLYLHIMGPIANFTTLGLLSDYLIHSSDWAVGAAILSTNAFFRDGHKYLGWFGFINSWFIGMYLFGIMFHHGLLAAILVHFLYDFLIYGVRYLDASWERANGYA